MSAMSTRSQCELVQNWQSFHQKLQLVRVRQVGHAQHSAESHVRYVHVNAAWNVSRQALNFNFTQHLVEDAALVLDAGCNARKLNRNFDANGLIQGNALQVNVQQGAPDRLILPVDDHGLGFRYLRTICSTDLHVKNRVVARIRVQDSGDLLGIDFDGHGRLGRSINHGGNFAPSAHAPGGILVELALARRCCYYFLAYHLSFSFGHDRDSV